MRYFRRLDVATVIVAALSMSLPFSHLMLMPARVEWHRDLWVDATVTGGEFRMYGSIGAVNTLAACVLLAVFAYAWRKKPRAGRLALSACALYFAGLALWFAVVMPVNRELARWLILGPPADWDRWRWRWEYGHASIAVLLLAGFTLLVAAFAARVDDASS